MFPDTIPLWLRLAVHGARWFHATLQYLPRLNVLGRFLLAEAMLPGDSSGSPPTPRRRWQAREVHA